jgi:exodeoxyribonuclease V alpha subunit
MLLSPYGIGPARIMKIFRKWGITAAQKIRSNPWLLAEEIEGTGFLTADRIAQGMGISRFDEHRLENAILFWLNRYTSSGHTWCSQDEMIEGSLVVAAIDKTTDNRNLLNQAIDRLISYNRLVRDNFIALPHIFQSEIACAERIVMLKNCSPQRFPDCRIISM